MRNLFEYTDGLNHPMEAFFHITNDHNFPILPHWHYFIEIIYLTKDIPKQLVIRQFMCCIPEI